MTRSTRPPLNVSSKAYPTTERWRVTIYVRMDLGSGTVVRVDSPFIYGRKASSV